MKNWQETQIIFDEIARLRETGGRFALAVVVGLQGSAYRKPGAKLLVREDGSMIGNVSGGCLESDVTENALAAIRSGKPKPLHYDTGGGEDKVWGLGVGCGGKVDLLVLPSSHDGFARVAGDVRRALRGDEAFSLSVALEGADVFGDCALGGEVAGATRVFTEQLEPPPRLIVCGAGENTRPLVRLATEAGFRVTMVDHRSAYLTKDRFPDAVALVHGRAEDVRFEHELGPGVFAAVMFHILAHDQAWVKRFAEGGLRYIGLLGSRSRREEVLSVLTDEQRSRVYGPIGLDLGAEGAEQIAVSIVAEMLAVRSGREPRHLRGRTKGIHEE